MKNLIYTLVDAKKRTLEYVALIIKIWTAIHLTDSRALVSRLQRDWTDSSDSSCFLKVLFI